MSDTLKPPFHIMEDGRAVWQHKGQIFERQGDEVLAGLGWVSVDSFIKAGSDYQVDPPNNILSRKCSRCETSLESIKAGAKRIDYHHCTEGTERYKVLGPIELVPLLKLFGSSSNIPDVFEEVPFDEFILVSPKERVVHADKFGINPEAERVVDGLVSKVQSDKSMPLRGDQESNPMINTSKKEAIDRAALELSVWGKTVNTQPLEELANTCERLTLRKARKAVYVMDLDVTDNRTLTSEDDYAVSFGQDLALKAIDALLDTPEPTPAPNTSNRTVGDSWLEAAQSRIDAGENEQKVLADYGYVVDPTARDRAIEYLDRDRFTTPIQHEDRQ